MPENLKILTTPDPETFSVAAVMATGDMLPDDMPKLGMLYEDCPNILRVRSDTWGKYVYVNNQTADDGLIWLIFAKPVTKEQAKCPAPFRITGQWDDYNWPQMLEDLPSGNQLEFINDNNFARVATRGFNVESATRVQIDYLMRPAWPGKTYIETREYLSPVPFTRDNILKTTVPVPTTIRFELIATLAADVRELGPCLHREVNIPELGESITNPDDDSPDYHSPLTEERNYAETNMTEWQSHVFYATQTWQNGLWYAVVKVALAPPMEPLLITE